MYNCFKDMTEENIIREFRLKDIDETRNHFVEEINHNWLMSNKHEKVCITLKSYQTLSYFSFCGY